MENESSNFFTENELRYLIINFILPFLSLEKEMQLNKKSEFFDDTRIKEAESLIFYDIDENVIRCFPSKTPKSDNEEFFFEINTNENKKLKVVREILTHILENKNIIINSNNNEDFIKISFQYLIEKGICSWLTRRKYNDLVYKLISKLKDWSMKTYEGNKVSFIIGIKEEIKVEDAFNFIDFLESNYSATISNANISGIIINDKGHFVSHEILDDPENDDNQIQYIVPSRYFNVAKSLYNKGCNLIFLLKENGEILIFKVEEKKEKKELKLVLALRNNLWKNYDAINFQTFMYKKGYESVEANSIYTAALDVAFENTGGLISICDDDKLDEIEKIIASDDNLIIDSIPKTEEKQMKRKFIEKIIEKSTTDEKTFYTLNRYARLEILNMDGASIINKNGKFISIATIVKEIEPGEAIGGGRTAATIKLSSYGIAIKISTDGGILLYKDGKNEFCI